MALVAPKILEDPDGTIHAYSDGEGIQMSTMERSSPVVMWPTIHLRQLAVTGLEEVPSRYLGPAQCNSGNSF